ncbi:MAG TPA: helix-turn-helix domain-containing protein [Acidimicrobiales bacterium]|nr:helix-turn-helix domain-containing protein [Acidimicrobiales bacterium]
MGIGLVERPGEAGEASVVETGARARAIEATLRCVARYGASKTTVDDVAREAKCSRATLYRAFPGGKDELMVAVVRSEVSRFFKVLARRMQEAGNLEELLVAAISTAVAEVEGHEALSFLMLHEPELVWPHVAFSELDRVLALAAAFVEPYLIDRLEPEHARRIGEWVARIVISNVVCPPASGSMDARSAQRLVRNFLLPGIGELESRQAARTA